MIEKGSSTDLVPVVSGLRREKSFFSLEMTPGGVRICLDHAISKLSGGTVAISELSLSVPWVKFPFDYTSGPRALQSHLTVFESVTVDIGFDLIKKFCSSSSIVKAVDVEIDAARADGFVISGIAAGSSFSVRTSFVSGSKGDLKVVFEYPRVFGLSDLSWAQLPCELYSGLPDCVVAGDFEISVLRPVLKSFMTGLGFKLPLIDRCVLKSAKVVAERVSLRFVRGCDDDLQPDKNDPGIPVDSFTSGNDPSDVFGRLNSSGRGPEAVINFIESGIGCSVLWPEILARSLALGHEHPECVSALLASVLAGAENPGWISPIEMGLICKRLLAAVETEGSGRELTRSATLIASIVDRFDPFEAMVLLDEIRGAGIENQPVLEAVAITFDRLARHFDASTTRLRALAMVPAPYVSGTVRNMVDRMDANGFQQQASAWLIDISELCLKGRFGSASGAIYRTAVIQIVSREAPSAKESSWKMLRQLLSTDPGDAEVLELMLALASEKHEVVEVIDLFRAAAESVDGAGRCSLLMTAGRAVYERFGLRHRAAELLVLALKADPGCKDAAELLDSIYETLGRSSERVSLAEQRLEHCSDIMERISILTTLMTTAEACGFNDRTSTAVKGLLRLDPANIVYLKAATEIFIKSGDLEALREAREAIEDLGSGSVADLVDDRSVDAALAAGNIPVAVAALVTLCDSMAESPLLVERLIQASDLALMAGLLEEASKLLIRLAGINPQAAVEVAVGALAVRGKDLLDLMLPVIRQAASASPGVGKQTEVAAVLFKAAERMLDISVEVAQPLLEMAVFLDPDNLSAVMTLAAVYESMGMVSESESLLLKMD